MSTIKASEILSIQLSEVSFGEKRICEMSGDSQLINVPVNHMIDISTLTADDSDPKFVNVEVIRAGISKGNRRRYSNFNVQEVNDMVTGVQGFFGHPDPSKHGFEFREPQCIFVGSMIEHMPDGLDRCIAKAYLFKTSPLREWVPKSIAAGNPMTVSINGTGDVMKNGDIIDVIHLRDLQSIDWANPGTEGMGTSQALSVVREMKEGGSNNMEGNAQDIIKNTTISEFRAYNPNGYNAVIQGATVAELQSLNPNVVKTIEESAKITEISIKSADGKEEMVKIAELQGRFDTLNAKITELNGAIEEAKITEYKNRKLAELVPENLREKISARVKGSTEKEIDASLDTEISYVREMGAKIENNPVGSYRRENKGGSDDVKSSVRGLFGVKEDKK